MSRSHQANFIHVRITNHNRPTMALDNCPSVEAAAQAHDRVKSWEIRALALRHLGALARDLSIGASALALVLGVPSMASALLDSTLEASAQPTLTYEVPPHEVKEERERRLREDVEDKTRFNECWEQVDLGAMRNSQRVTCLKQEHARLQAILDIEAAQLRESMTGRSLAVFGASMRAWAVHRDQWCELDSIRNQVPSPQVSGLLCATELTRDFIVTLRKAP